MFKRTAFFLAILSSMALGHQQTAIAAVPATLTQQGRLLDSTGAAVDGVQLQFSFALYNAPTGGDALWNETQTITPDQGYFSARLGEATSFPATLFDGSQGALYLGISIGKDQEMTPRQELTSVPFALLAAKALQASGALDTRITTLENQVKALNAAPKSFGGSFFFGAAECQSAASPCVIDISGGKFTTSPYCAVTNVAIDDSGYTENAVIQDTSATTLKVWKGKFLTGGTSLSGVFVCVGT